MTYLVTGATGNVGRHVVAGLAGHPIRALTRGSLGPPYVTGSLPDLSPEVLDGVRSVFLLWPFTSGSGAAPLVDLLASRVSHVVFLSALGASDSSPLFHAGMESLLRSSGLSWTFLRAGGFATNTLGWASGVRAGVVRWIYGGAGRSLIHERDIADVAVAALTSPGHEGQVYDLTGPAVITQAEQVAAIGRAVGRPVRWEELSYDEAREVLSAQGWDANFASHALRYWSTLEANPEPVTDTVEKVTGHAARTFDEWARDHVDDFR